MHMSREKAETVTRLETVPHALDALQQRVWRRLRYVLAFLAVSIAGQLWGKPTSGVDSIMWWIIRWIALSLGWVELWASLAARRFSIDRAAGEMILEESDVTGLLRRKRVFIVGEIDRVCVRTIRPGRVPFSGRHCGVEFQLWLTAGGESRRESFVIPEDFRNRKPALWGEIARVGSDLGMSRWRLDWSDALHAHVTLGREDLEEGVPIADYEEASGTATAPPLSAWGRGETGPTLDVVRSDAALADWRPGISVSFRRPLQGSSLGFIAVMVVLWSGIIADEFAQGHDPRQGSYHTRKGLGFSLLAVALIAMIPGTLPWRSRIDWARRQASAGLPLFARRLALDRVARVEVAARRVSRWIDCDQFCTRYIASIRLRGHRRWLLPGKSLLLLEAEDVGSCRTAIRTAFPIARAIATAIGVDVQVKRLFFLPWP